MTRRSSHSDVPLRDWHDREPKDPKQIEVQVQEQPPDSDADADMYWQPGVKSQFPWFGFGALITMLICASLTVVILTTSDAKVAEKWPAYQHYEWIKQSWRTKAQLTPSTALALVNTIYNVALAVAIGNGVVIAWWRKALHGATVQDLHQSWAYSTSLFELVTAGKNFNFIALCALTAKFALVDNVLLQQATSTTFSSFTQNVTDIRFPIAKELPAKFLGTWSDDGRTGSLSDIFTQDLYYYFNSPRQMDLLFGFLEVGSEYVPFDTRCRNQCSVNVDGFGANVSCTDEVVSTYEVTPQILMKAANSNSSSNDTDTSLLDAASTLMHTSFESWVAGSDEVDFPDPWIKMTVEYATIASNETNTNPDGSTAASTAQTCQGQLNRRTCSIRPALLKYGLTLTNVSESSTADNGIYGYRNGLLSPAYQTNSSAYDDVMHSLYKVLSNSFATTVILDYLNGTGFAAQSSTGGFIGQFLAQANTAHSFPSSCVISVNDPTQWIQDQIDSILLRASISAAAAATGNVPIYSEFSRQVLPEHVVENIAGYRYIDTVEYVSLYAWMAAALGVMALCIVCVLPTYWGYWELGRRVTFGPMEIASAFQAPVLDSSVTAAGGEVEKVLKEVGQREVRYGVVVGSGKLAMAEASETVQLKPGAPIRTAGDM